jgi:hypothetical protein
LARLGEHDAAQVLLPKLGEYKHPGRAAESALRTAMVGAKDAEVRATALLAFGNLARNAARRDKARAAALVIELSGRLELASDPEEKRILLLAVGNAARPECFRPVKKRLADPLPALRAAAVFALRFLDGAEEEVLETLRTDKDPGVRRLAANALAFRGGQNVQLLKIQIDAFGAERDPKVREALLPNLWRGRGALPDANEVVRRAAESDADENVRRSAREMMSAGRADNG